tara:strand:+ start:35 stop:589 length:555 start_codon:yes stop_codon:yes gene_type:complete
MKSTGENQIKAEMLSKMLPKSLDMSSVGSGKSHNAITPEDISVILSYSNLTQNQTDFLLMKYLSDYSAMNRLFSHFYAKAEEIFEDIKFKHPKKTLEKIVNCAILECVMTSCPVCNGVGYTTFNKTIEKCRHCNEGVFIYDDFTRCQIMTIKKATYGKIRRGYKEIMEMFYDLEQVSLSKIGDT